LRKFLLLLAPILFSLSVLAQTPGQEPVTSIALQPELLRLSVHKGFFFLYGNPSGKVQISAKHQLIAGDNFYVAYTQLMVWEFGKDSTPFSDVNFNPEFFYRHTVNQRFYIDLGPFEHDSNGRDGSASRSINTTYVRFSNIFDLGPGEIETGVKVFALWGLDSNTPDQRDYMGFWNGTVAWSFKDYFLPYWQIYFHVQPGEAWGNRFDRGNEEVGLSMKFEHGTTLPFLFIQYFNGYGETLLQYDHPSSAIRIGLRR
jgi:outer membrane phospholipase A